MTKSDGRPCERCGTSDWYKNGDCKECKRKRNADQRDRKPNYHRKWKEQNPDYYSEWQQKNPDYMKDYSQTWRRNYPDKAQESKRQYRATNRERVLANDRRWRRNNPNKVKAGRQRYRTKRSGAGGSFTAAEWKTLCKQYDNHCCYPGCERTDLHADHVLPVSMGGSSNIDNIQPLCCHHNTSKGAKHIDYRTKPGILRWIQKKLFG